MSPETLDQVKHIPLHLHTEFSLLDGASRVEDICAKAKANDMPGLALTDHGTMFGAYKFYTEATKNGIKPIVGCEIYVINGDHLLKGKEHRLKLYHLVLLAKNDQGYLNLIKIVSESCINGRKARGRFDPQARGRQQAQQHTAARGVEPLQLRVAARSLRAQSLRSQCTVEHQCLRSMGSRAREDAIH